jgi:hypothetical protein
MFAGRTPDSGEDRSMEAQSLSLPSVLRTGVVAGLAGAILIDAYLIATVVLVSHAATLEGFYQFVASGAIGPSAYAGGSGAVLIGICVHVFTSIAWAIGYAYLAASTPQLRSRPIVSGIAYGILVMLAMQIVEVAANIYTIPGPAAWFNTFFAHTLFFGLPVALVTARMSRT